MSVALSMGFAMFLAKFVKKLFGETMTGRPIIIGPIVGLLLGDLQKGIIIGAQLELIFLGTIAIGGALPADTQVGGVFGTAFAILLNKGPEVAVSLALPASLAIGILLDQSINYLTALFVPKAQEYAADGNEKGIKLIHYGWLIGNPLFYAFFTFLAFLVGVDAVNTFVDGVPQVIMDGLTGASGILPAFGFATLLNMMWDSKIVIFFLFGFVVVSYLNLPLIALALIGAVIAVYIGVSKKETMDELQKVKAGSLSGTDMGSGTWDNGKGDFFND